MNKNLWMFLSALCLVVILVGCASNNQNKNGETASNTQETSGESSKSDKKGKAGGKKSASNLSLPTGVPSDFPLPDGMVITEIEDESDADKYDYEWRFDFNPELDIEVLFDAYVDYADNLSYTIVSENRDGSPNNLYQIAATSTQTASNMFIVTLKKESPTFGSIKLKLLK